MHVSTRLCWGCVIYSPTASGAKWSEQQLLVRLKEKPPQGEGCRNDLTLHRQKCRCVMSGFWAEGNSPPAVKLSEASCVLLEHSLSVFTGNLPLGSECWEVQAGRWGQGSKLYCMTAHLGALGAASLLLESETEGKSSLAALKLFFLHEKVIIFFSPPVHWFCTMGTRGRVSKIAGPSPTCSSGIRGVPVPSPSTVLRLCTNLRFCVAWAAPIFVIADIWYLTHLEQVKVLLSLSLCECLTFPLLWAKSWKGSQFI